MWASEAAGKDNSGEDDRGDEMNGTAKHQAVRLYQPIPYGRKQQPSSDDHDHDITSFVGGRATGTASTAPCCAICHDRLFLLVQLHVPDIDDKSGSGSGTQPQRSKTVQVFGCNRLTCLQGLFTTAATVASSNSHDDSKNHRRDNMLCYDSRGVVVCRRVTTTVVEDPGGTSSTTTKKTSGESKEDDNEWDLGANDSGGNTGLDDLEAKLAAMEATTASKPKSSASSSAAASKQLAPSSTKSQQPNCFPWFVLHSVQEPPVVQRSNTDQDDVGIGDGRKDDAKIKRMLAKYMAEEEDEDVLAMLRGATSSGGGKGGGSGERDERLSATDRALLTFSDRLKRSPKQVVRYARGGRPLWSIPTVSLEKQADERRDNKNRRNRKEGKKQSPPNSSSTSKLLGLEKPVPPCGACGAPRVFEFQLVPPLLHVLQVDKHAKSSDTKKNDNSQSLDSVYQQGGMDWGNIAVYTCSNPACFPDTVVEEFCVVQDSVDERPTGRKREMPLGAAIIQEDAMFDEDDEEEEDEGANDDDDEAWEEDDFDDDDEIWND